MNRYITIIITALLAFCACDKTTDLKKETDKFITFSGTKEAPSATFSSSENSWTVTFNAPEDWSITTNSECKWLKINPMKGAKGDNTLTIKIDENTDYDSRETSVMISCTSDKKQIKITQAAKGAVLLESKDLVKVSVLGGDFKVKLKYNLDFEVSSDVDWISKNENTKALKESEISFDVDVNDSGKTRSGKLTFRAKDGSVSEELMVEQAHEIVITEDDEIDLGLSVKWARTNLGATNPENRGNLYAWGEIDTHKDDKFYGDDYKRTKNSYYRPSDDFDQRNHLSDDDDAATANLGNKWRMPTQEEMFELLSLKFAYPFNYKDNQGLLIISPNGNNLFIPATGYEMGYGAPEPNRYDVVCFWTNTVAEDNEDQAYILSSHIRNSIVPGLPFISGSQVMMERFAGLPVRAVRRANITFGEFKAEVGETSAKLSVDLNLDGVDVSKIKKAGFLYSVTGYFDATSKVDSLFCTPTASNMSYTWENLEASSTYKVRPFLVVEKEGNYTDKEQSITTKEGAKPEQWIDLGLSVLWASWNIGATNPGENGDSFHWGDVEPKGNDSYNMSAYKYYVPGSKKEINYWEDGKDRTVFYYYKFTKYDKDDEKTKLEPSDDAAYFHWGNGARTPSKDEVSELLKNCELKEITKYGSRGYLFTSKINGNSIFISSQSKYSLYYKLWTSDLDVRKRDIYYNRGTTIDETLYDYSHSFLLITDHIGKLTRETLACVRAVKDK